MVQQLATNTFTVAKWIVSADATQGTHTTLTSALASATAGDTIVMLPGTYPEDPNLKTGVNITGMPGDSLNPNVTIIGKCTYSGAGLVLLNNLCLQTNSDYYLVNSGSGKIECINCFLNTLDHTGINISSGAIEIQRCTEQAGITGISLFTQTGGSLIIKYSTISAGSGTTTASTSSAGSTNFQYSYFAYPFTTSSTAIFLGQFAQFQTGATSTIAITSGGASGSLLNCNLSSGTAECITIAAGSTVTVAASTLTSSGANVLTGLGTVNTGGNVCIQGSGNTVSTINHLTVI